MKLLASTICLVFLAACTATETPEPDVTVLLSDGGNVDAQATDVRVQNVVEIGAFIRVTEQNQSISGEVVGLCDHSVFWGAPENKTTFALYRDQEFRAFPNDESIRFFERDSVVAVRTDRPAGSMSFSDRAREHLLLVERPPLVGVQNILMGNSTYHLEEDGFGHFAFDLTRLDTSGRRFSEQGLQNEDYVVFGTDVHSPASGVVVDVIRDIPDNLPGSFPNPDDFLSTPNNLVGIHLSGNYYLYLLHFEADSIPPELDFGDTVALGDFLGRVGNSGVSLEPHLHIVLYYFDETSERSWSIPLQWANVQVDDAPQEFSVPITGQNVRALD